MEIRPIKISDAERFVHLIKKVESESPFMLYEAGERMIELKQQEKRIETMQKEGNCTIFVAEVNTELIGYLIALGGNAKRNKHSVYVVIGILTQYQGTGIGTKLFAYLEDWAADHHVHRLELTVITRNEAGVRLYKKMGFEIEGTKRHSLFIDGKFEDEYHMSKLLLYKE